MIAAASLVSDNGMTSVTSVSRTLADGDDDSGDDGRVADATLGSGAFGKVDTYNYHGAVVAVKELKAGSEEESIGVCSFDCGNLPSVRLGRGLGDAAVSRCSKIAPLVASVFYHYTDRVPTPKPL